MTERCAIYGAGGHARVVASILRARDVDVIGCFDDSAGGTVLGYPILGGFDAIFDRRDIDAVYLALGDNWRREAAFSSLRDSGFRLPPLVHPCALVEADVVIGDGAVVCLGATLAVESTVGDGALVNTRASVDHESSVGAFSHIAPQVAVAGRTRVGRCCFVGIGASIADGIYIGDAAVVGAGSVVLSDVAAGAKVVGVHR